jgi:hypothetical protein
MGEQVTNTKFTKHISVPFLHYGTLYCFYSHALCAPMHYLCMPPHPTIPPHHIIHRTLQASSSATRPKKALARAAGVAGVAAVA